MYVEFLAYLDNRRCPQSLQDKIAAFAADFDLSCFMDIETDEQGDYARFWSGDDEFYNDESELLEEDSPEYEEAVLSNEAYCLSTYIGLLKLQESGEIKDCWLQGGWQFGKRPDMKTAIVNYHTRNRHQRRGANHNTDMLVKVKYQIATYSGEVSVNAEPHDDNEVIIAKAKRQLIQRSGPLPFGYQSFEVIRP